MKKFWHIFFLQLWLLSVNAHAFAPPVVVAGNTVTVGTVIADAKTAADITFKVAGDAIATASKASIRTAAGDIAVVAESQIPRARAAAMIAGSAGIIAAGAVVAGAVGYGIYKVAGSVGYKPKWVNGEVVWEKTDPDVCSADCVEYQFQFSGYGVGSPLRYKSIGKACAAMSSAWGNQVDTDVQGMKCRRVMNPDSPYDWIKYTDYGLTKYPVEPDPNPPTVPATPAQLQEELVRSRAWEPYADDALHDALRMGQTQPLSTERVTGPASVPGPTTVTQSTGPAGPVTTTTNVTNNYKYEGPKVTQTTTTTTNVTNNTTGETKTDTKTEEPKQPEPEPPVQDTPLSDIPFLYKPKYKDGLTGVWNTKKEQLKQSPLFSLASKLMPSVGSSGACPKFTVPLDLGPWNYGNGDFSPPCWVWDACKAFVIVGALLLARALIFGG